MGFGQQSTILRPRTSIMLNMLLVRVLFILCVTLVGMLTVSDIGPFGLLLALAAWGVMELAGVFRLRQAESEAVQSPMMFRQQQRPRTAE